MEWQRRCLIFFTGVGVLVMLFPIYKGVEWIWPLKNTIEYLLQWTYLICALIVIAFGRNTGLVETTQRPTSNKRPKTVVGKSQAVQVNHVTKRETRLQSDFLATASSKTPSKARTSEKTAVTEAVRENIMMIEKDLIVTESTLLDEMQDYLSEEEVNMMKNRSRKDQAHLFAAKLEACDNETFLSVLEILVKASFGHVAERLKASFEKHSTSKLTSSLCSVCRIRSEVDIKNLRCNLKLGGFLTPSLYNNINQCQADKGHQNALWEELFFHLKSKQPKEEIMWKFINFFNTPKHQGLHNHLRKHPPTRYVCTCSCKAKSSLEIDGLKPKITTSDTSDESNTQTLDYHREDEWYLDALDSATNSESGSRARKLPKLCHDSRESNKADDRRTKQRFNNDPIRKGTKKNILTRPRLSSDDSSSVSSLDSNPSRHNFTLTQIPPQAKKRAEKRTMREVERSSNENFGVGPSELMESDTERKTIIESITLRKTPPPIISVRPYIAESDFNSDGESRKHYWIPDNPCYRKYPKDSEFSEDAVPTAFAKTLKSGGNTQIW
ncbi:uncharacterized protein LOC125676370 isoform X3 [Ostrea edulis]|nr:uncharacterized protein LOC125676370 isoform X3 [Ostrea edulis]